MVTLNTQTYMRVRLACVNLQLLDLFQGDILYGSYSQDLPFLIITIKYTSLNGAKTWNST